MRFLGYRAIDKGGDARQLQAFGLVRLLFHQAQRAQCLLLGGRLRQAEQLQ